MPRGEKDMAPQTELELELTLRGSLLIQQQRRIIQLEQELSRAQYDIAQLREQLQGQAKKRSEEKKPGERFWKPEEHQRFLEAIEKYGPKDHKNISSYVGTKNPTQVRTHAQKYFIRLAKEQEKKRSEAQQSSSAATSTVGSSPENTTATTSQPMTAPTIVATAQSIQHAAPAQPFNPTNNSSGAHFSLPPTAMPQATPTVTVTARDSSSQQATVSQQPQTTNQLRGAGAGPIPHPSPTHPPSNPSGQSTALEAPL